MVRSKVHDLLSLFLQSHALTKEFQRPTYGNSLGSEKESKIKFMEI